MNVQPKPTHLQTLKFVPDLRLGWRGEAGAHVVSLERNGRLFQFRAVHGEDGFRLTTEEPEDAPADPRIWLFGCSWAYGHLVDQTDSFAARLQQQFPDLGVRNFGISGQCTVQSILNLERALQTETPRLVILSYLPCTGETATDSHADRNIVAIPWLANMQAGHAAGDRPVHSDMMLPRASLDLNGDVQVDYVPVYDYDLRELPTALFAANAFYKFLVTRRLFERAIELSLERGFALAVAYHFKTDYDPVLHWLAEAPGVMLIDATIERTAEFTFLPHDMHPNPRAHASMAERIARTVAAVCD